MSKNTTRNILFALLLMTSLGSYAFLSSRTVDADAGMASTTAKTERIESEVGMPEVMIVRQIIDLGKWFTSISR